MNRNLLIMMVALLAITWSCQKDDIQNFSQNDEIALKSQPVPGDYNITFSYIGETTLTFEINQSGAQDISHMLFQFIDCEGEYLTSDDVTSATVNEVAWDIDTSTGTDCVFDDGPFIKLDDFDDFGDIVTVVIVLDKKVANVDYLIKSATNCFGFSEATEICGPDDFPPACFEWKTETAWADGYRYVNRGNWATYSPYTTTEPVTLFAGQTIPVGTVEFSEVVDGEVTITITLDGWQLAIYDYDEFGVEVEDVYREETVKIQGYNVTPPARNPAPGRFNTYKGNELVITVPAFEFYGIHLDVGLLTEVECPVDVE